MTGKTRKAWRKSRKIAEPVVSIDGYLTREVVARDHVGKHRWPDAALMAIATWTSEGESAEDIADRLGITRRAVVQYRNVCRDRALIA